MRQKERQKLCGNCDGRIPFEAIICPYCAAECTPHGSGSDVDFRKQQSLNDSLSALYPPPYAAKNVNPAPAEQHKSVSSFKQVDPFKDVSEKRFATAVSMGSPVIAAEETDQVEDKSSFWPLFFLSVGANLLMLGLLQLFFSEGGVLKLEWNSSYWFVYCLAAAPLVLLGFKKANQLK